METLALPDTPLLRPADRLCTASAPAASPAAPGGSGETGSVCWPLEPDGPAQTLLDLLVQAAHALDHDVPDTLVVRAGQLFYRAGQLEEVRLAGVLPGAPDAVSHRHNTAWRTPTPPTLQEGPDGTVFLHPTDAARPHYAVLVVRDAAVPHQTPKG